MDASNFGRVLSSYQNLGSLAYAKASVATAEDAHNFLRWFLIDIPIVPVLLAFHSLFAALSVHKLTKGNQFWLKSLVLTAFAAFGGSTLSNVLAGMPAPLFTVSSNYMMSYITLAWYIVNHSAPIRSVLSFRPVCAVLSFGAMAAKSRSIFSFVDTFTTRFPGATAGAIVLGGLAGSGGSLFVSLEKIVMHGLDAPSEFSSPGWGFKSAYIASATYYIATDPDGVLRALPIPLKYAVNRDEARFWIAFALCTHAALETLYGRHVNPVWWLEELFFAVTSVQKDPVVETRAQPEAAQRLGTEKRAWVDSIESEGVRRRHGKGE